ncbi:hypothetical protein [Youngiibacter fragilis]|uniref:hypothetical protein n=1 Tax=Youngiibacter fragilis TaxID=1408819 RepID=UPI0005943751|nr:hypothetical protein [Youngiibacter fragilis]
MGKPVDGGNESGFLVSIHDDRITGILHKGQNAWSFGHIVTYRGKSIPMQGTDALELVRLW